MGFLAPFVGRLYDKVGATVLVVPGSIIVSGALWFMVTLGAGSSIVTVLVAHIVLSIGLALAFTPLFTSGLASLSPQFYSHGSATVSTVQQLAGAVGIAVFITVMTTTSTPRIEDGASVIAATADGIHSAFLGGAILSLIAIPLAFFIRKSASGRASVPVGH
jgi:DHA2 family lincomycin resistance protein-like MFS transporter